MKRTIYLLIPISLIILSLFIVSCGDNNTGALPEISQQPQMVQKSVSGYIFHLPGQGVNDFIIIDAPVSGEDSFINQMKSYLETNYPEVWNSNEIQSIYNQLSEEISDWQTLLKYNPGAQLFCAYSDTPIPVGEDGYFETVVSVPSGDENITFEVVIGEEAFGAETIASSDFITSASTGTGQLKCGNKSIIALPGGLSIFKVFSVPGISLKEGLSFELDDNYIGSITPPFFLKINGELNYNLAYGVFKANNIAAKSAETKVSNGNGNNLYIPTDIVHEIVSISGKVYTGGEPLIKGYVSSIGPKSFCHLDENGNYVLPEVFKGAYRKVTATWWTGDQQGNNKTKHTEIRYVEYLDSNLTGFNFGVPVEPTVTPTPTPIERNPNDPFYDRQISKVVKQIHVWEEIYGDGQAVPITVDWLTGNLTDPPIPSGIEGAFPDDEDPTLIHILFDDGMYVAIGTSYENSLIMAPVESNTLLNEQIVPDGEKDSPVIVTNEDEGETVSVNSVLVLDPFGWQVNSDFPEVGIEDLRTDLEKTYGNNLEMIITEQEDISIVKDPERDDLYIFQLKDPNSEVNVVDPNDFKKMSSYDLTIVFGHGHDNIAIPYITSGDPNNPSDVEKWIADNKDHKLDPNTGKGTWSYLYQDNVDFDKYFDNAPSGETLLRVILVQKEFFNQINTEGKVIILFTCRSLDKLKEPFEKTKAYMGFENNYGMEWGKGLLYYLLLNMMYNPVGPSGMSEYEPGPWEGTPPPNRPLTLSESLDALNYYGVNPSPEKNTYELDSLQETIPSIRLSTPITIIINGE